MIVRSMCVVARVRPISQGLAREPSNIEWCELQPWRIKILPALALHNALAEVDDIRF